MQRCSGVVMPKISVIIPSYNEEKYLNYPLNALHKQTFKDFEIIVVDGNSSDKTRDIAKKHGARIIIEKRKGIGLARNTGAKKARGSILFFTNADTAPSPDVLNIYNELFKDNAVVAATGPMVPLEKTTHFIQFGYKFASVSLAKFSFKLGMPAMSGSNIAVRKASFEKAGGFNELLETYEDIDLIARVKRLGSVVYADDAVVATSTRRIEAWGVRKYILFNAGNVLRYNLSKRSKKNYEPIR